MFLEFPVLKSWNSVFWLSYSKNKTGDIDGTLSYRMWRLSADVGW